MKIGEEAVGILLMRCLALSATNFHILHFFSTCNLKDVIWVWFWAIPFTKPPSTFVLRKIPVGVGVGVGVSQSVSQSLTNSVWLPVSVFSTNAHGF